MGRVLRARRSQAGSGGVLWEERLVKATASAGPGRAASGVPGGWAAGRFEAGARKAAGGEGTLVHGPSVDLDSGGLLGVGPTLRGAQDRRGGTTRPCWPRTPSGGRKLQGVCRWPVEWTGKASLGIVQNWTGSHLTYLACTFAGHALECGLCECRRGWGL